MEQQDYLTTGNIELKQLPNATTSLVLGILSIVICGVGIVLGIIGIVMANKDIALYESNPGGYSEPSYKNSKTGRICSIIGIVLNAVGVIGYIAMIAFFMTTIGAAGGLR